MIKILVVFVVIATGEPVKMIQTSDEFETMAACQAFLAENEAIIVAQVEQNSSGQLTIKSKCVDLTPKQPV